MSNPPHIHRMNFVISPTRHAKLKSTTDTEIAVGIYVRFVPAEGTISATVLAIWVEFEETDEVVKGGFEGGGKWHPMICLFVLYYICNC
jgi:hypothetical protein